MGYQYKFKDGELYDVNDVNGIVSHFTSAGVSTYSDLNGISGALTDMGVSNAYNSCKVVKDGEKLKIMPGEAFFSDGSVISVDSSGVSFDPLRYVYFKKDTITETGYPVCSDTAPSGSDIPLAEYENGVLTDKRQRATSKVQGFGSTIFKKKIVKISNVAAATEYTTIYTFYDIARDFRYVMLFDDAEEVTDKKFLAWGDMVSGKYWSATTKYNDEAGLIFGADQIELYHHLNAEVSRLKFVKNGVNIEMQYYGKNYGKLEAQIFFA